MTEPGSKTCSRTVAQQRTTSDSDAVPNGLRCGPGKRWHLAGLVGVMLLTGALRLGGITQVGIRYDDESWYASDARLWHRCALVLTDGTAIRAVFRGDKQAFQQRMDAIGVDFAGRYDKPCRGYTFLGAITMFIVGDRPAALPATNAICGTLSVLVLYGVGCVLFNRSVGLCAALLLAVSPYHLVYCRSALPDASVAFFVLLGVLAWSLGRRGLWTLRWAYLCAGLAFGYAILCHFRSGYIPLVLVAFDLFVPVQVDVGSGRKPSRDVGVVRRLAYLAVGAAIPIIAMEAVFRAAYLAAAITDSYLPGTSYLDSCFAYVKLWMGVVSQDPQGASRNTGVLNAYIAYFVHWHGMIATIATGAGLVVSLRLKGAAKWPAVLVMATLGILLLQRCTVARAMSPIVPFACLCLAVGVYRFLGAVGILARFVPVIALAACALLAYPALTASWSLHGKRSHIADACAFVAQRGGAVAVPLDPKKYALYLERTETEVAAVERLRDLQSPTEVLAELRSRGVRWMITDAQNWHYRNPDDGADAVFWWWQAMDEHLAESAQLVASFPHMADYRWEFMSEGWGLEHLSEMIGSEGGTLRVYDIQQTVGAAADTRTEQTTMSASIAPGA